VSLRTLVPSIQAKPTLTSLLELFLIFKLFNLGYDVSYARFNGGVKIVMLSSKQL
jgi:hypothetical protein